MSKLEEFLAGERLEDVALFLTHDYLDEKGRIANYGEDVEDGVVLVVPGDDGRGMFAAGTGMDAMEFARGAMERDGEIAPELAGGECPAAGEGGGEPEPEPGDGEATGDGSGPEGEGGAGIRADDHRVKFVFAFAEAENEEVGGLYAEGDVIHAYAQCECGEAYSDRWVAGTR
jgi:hypothetical protein